MGGNMMEVSKWFEFEAAHSLPHLPYTHKCHRLHGHSYKVCVVCAGAVNKELGWVIDYADISKVVRLVIDAIDHTNLDQLFTVPPRPITNDAGGPRVATTHKTIPSTAENLAIWFFNQLAPTLPVVEIRVKETASTEVVYRPHPNRGSGGTP
jgi:6-pyruvoyltetrahydropterin/6-carboxytetrahydropterin synthase